MYHVRSLLCAQNGKGALKEVNGVSGQAGQELKCVLTIAGSDSGAGAGIQADLKTMGALDVYGLTAITAITAQNTVAVKKSELLATETIRAQIDAVAEDFPIAAVKTGMLGNARIVEAVAAKICQHRLPNVVVDPVMVAKGGDHLLEQDAQRALRERLFPLARIITPNLPEAEALCGITIKDFKEMQTAARLLYEQGPSFVLLKGGHFYHGEHLLDLLYDGNKFYFYRALRIETRDTHGTGCTLAAAIASYLARGQAVPWAVRSAREYLQGIITSNLGLGRGSGPLDHFAAWRKP
jgi:hydroxymethylpyrimidine/phosphomethylpyrimidine kinase